MPSEITKQTIQSPVDCTQWWLKDGKTHQPDGAEGLRYKAIPLALEIKAAEDLPEGGLIAIQGWASTSQLDSYNDIVEPEAFRSSLSEFTERGTMLFMHDWYGVPIGKFNIVRIEVEGLWVEGYIINTSQGRDVAEALKHSILNALSIGFSIKNYTMDTDTDVRTIHDLKLYEVSIVHVGANPGASFSVSKESEKHDCGFVTKSLQSLTASLGGEGNNHKESVMAEPEAPAILDERIGKAEKLVSNIGTSLDTVSGDMNDLAKNVENLGKLQKALTEKLDEHTKGQVSLDEYKTFVDKIGADMLLLQEAIQKAARAKEINKDLLPFTDWRVDDPLRIICDDNGKALGPMAQKAYKYFQKPVDLKGGDGELIKTMRNLNDVVVLTDAVMRSANRRYDITSLKSYQALHELMGAVDPEFAKAMYSTGTGVGDEWVPELMSSELYDLYRLEARVESFLPTFDMPSNPFKWDIKTSGLSLYVTSESAVNNPDQLVKSNIGTSNVTFTARTYASAVLSSPELVEDSIIAIVPEIRKELAICSASGYESALLNGDDTSTHRDTGWSYASGNPEYGEDGFRFMAVDASKSFDTASTTTGVGDASSTFAAKDIRYGRKTMGKMGARTDKIFFVCNTDVWFHMLSLAEFSQPGTYGGNASWVSGALTYADGCEVVISEHMSNEETTAGIYDGSTKTKSSLLCINKEAFKVGHRRGYTVEFGKDILTQQLAFVGTMRKCMRKMTASTLYPVTLGYNITS